MLKILCFFALFLVVGLVKAQSFYYVYDHEVPESLRIDCRPANEKIDKGIRCCSGSGATLTCSSRDNNNNCYGDNIALSDDKFFIDYTNASLTCAANDGRLCTLDEYIAECIFTGCLLAHRQVWTSTPCAPSYIVGRSDPQETECVRASSSSKTVRCCSLDLSSCYSRRPDDITCYSNLSSIHDAVLACENDDRRLCNGSHVTTICADTGCAYNDDFVWSNSLCNVTISPTHYPTVSPTIVTSNPTKNPSIPTTKNPSTMPTDNPTHNPSMTPTLLPSLQPTMIPTVIPTRNPTVNPTKNPSIPPTKNPSTIPTENPSSLPTENPTNIPSPYPTIPPSLQPTMIPTKIPTMTPTVIPTVMPTMIPTVIPTMIPTVIPTKNPTQITEYPTIYPINSPTNNPTYLPTNIPSVTPSTYPTNDPTINIGSNNNQSHSSVTNEIWFLLLISVIGAAIVAVPLMYLLCHQKQNSHEFRSLSTTQSPITSKQVIEINEIESPQNNPVFIPSTDLHTESTTTQGNKKFSLNANTTRGNNENTIDNSDEINVSDKNEVRTPNGDLTIPKKILQIVTKREENDEINDNEIDTEDIINAINDDISTNTEPGGEDDNSESSQDNQTTIEGERINLGNVNQWTNQEVLLWLNNTVKLAQYDEIFKNNDITGRSLISLDHNILKEIGVISYGHRFDILQCIQQL